MRTGVPADPVLPGIARVKMTQHLGTGRENALHAVYGAESGYKPAIDHVGFYE